MIYSRVQQVRPATSAEIYHEIAQLSILPGFMWQHILMMKNTRLLAWLVNQVSISAQLISHFTRGDGGQNILAVNKAQHLALIRTHELLEARKK